MAVTWGSAYGAITNEEQRRGVFELPPRYTSGQTLGIIAVDLDYPKVPGNVVNATTYDFPVLYEMVSFEIEQPFAGDPAIKQQVIEAAKKLEAEGVRAIIGACGYFAHFQKDVAAAVGVPVFMSSLCQLATIKTWLPCDRKIAVFAADGASIDDEFLSNVNTTTDQIVVVNVGDMESFAPIRWGKGPLENLRTICARWQNQYARAIQRSMRFFWNVAICRHTPLQSNAQQACLFSTLLPLQNGWKALWCNALITGRFKVGDALASLNRLNLCPLLRSTLKEETYLKHLWCMEFIFKFSEFA